MADGFTSRIAHTWTRWATQPSFLSFRSCCSSIPSLKSPMFQTTIRTCSIAILNRIQGLIRLVRSRPIRTPQGRIQSIRILPSGSCFAASLTDAFAQEKKSAEPCNAPRTSPEQSQAQGLSDCRERKRPGECASQPAPARSQRSVCAFLWSISNTKGPGSRCGKQDRMSLWSMSAVRRNASNATAVERLVTPLSKWLAAILRTLRLSIKSLIAPTPGKCLAEEDRSLVEAFTRRRPQTPIAQAMRRSVSNAREALSQRLKLRSTAMPVEE